MFPINLSAASLAGLPLLLLVAATLIKLFFASQRPKGFPGGPATVPFLGNLHQIPPAKIFLQFNKWRKEYGDIIGLKFGPQNILILNSYKHVKELYDKRGSIYSSRPENYIANQLICPNNVHILLVPYSAGWRKLRKAVQQLLNTKAVDALLPIQDAEALQTMHDLIHSQQDYYNHFRRYSTAVILASVFGQRGARFESEKVQALYHAQNQFTEILEPGATPPVDSFPALKYLPEFMAPWKAKARAIRAEQKNLYWALHEETRLKVAQGQRQYCFIATLMRDQEKRGLTEEEVVYVGGILMEAGSDTTASTLLTLCLALLTHPEILKKCQDEIDQKCPNQPPTAADIDSLPYLRACMTEVLRWRPLVAGGIPHVAIQDDEYGSCLIPKGTMVFANAYSIHHDPDEYENPSAFMPERFLKNKFGTKTTANASENDGRRVTYSFGAGRRVCPGQKMSENSLLVNMAKLVWTFNMEPTGIVDTAVETGFTDGLLLCPKKFPVVFKPRDEWRVTMIEEAFTKAEVFLQKFQ